MITCRSCQGLVRDPKLKKGSLFFIFSGEDGVERPANDLFKVGNRKSEA